MPDPPRTRRDNASRHRAEIVSLRRQRYLPEEIAKHLDLCYNGVSEVLREENLHRISAGSAVRIALPVIREFLRRRPQQFHQIDLEDIIASKAPAFREHLTDPIRRKAMRVKLNVLLRRLGYVKDSANQRGYYYVRVRDVNPDLEDV